MHFRRALGPFFDTKSLPVPANFEKVGPRLEARKARASDPKSNNGTHEIAGWSGSDPQRLEWILEARPTQWRE